MTIFESSRLIIRQFRETDYPALVQMLTDAEVMRYIGKGQPRTHQQIRSMLAFYLRDYERGWNRKSLLRRQPELQGRRGRPIHFSQWAVVLRDEMRLIGRCGFLPVQVDGTAEVEAGYMINRSYWGCGYATEAATAVRDYGLEELGLRRIISIILPGNTASRRVAKKIGMRHEKNTIFRELHACIYGLTADVPVGASATPPAQCGGISN